jgi:hypothetical protein
MNRQSLLTRYRPLVLVLTVALAITAFTTAPAAANDIAIEGGGGGKQCEVMCWTWDIERGWSNCHNCCVENGEFTGCTPVNN